MNQRYNIIESFYTPIASGTGGSSTVTIINNTATIEDPFRNKTLSVDRIYANFCINSKNISSIRKFSYNSIISSLNTFTLIDNYTLISFLYNSSNQSNADIKIIKNNINIVFLNTLVSEKTKFDDTLNIDFVSNDYISVILDVNSGHVDYPILSLEFAKKY